MVPFPVNDTTISILKHVVGDNEDELDFIYAFREKASQTMEQMKGSIEFPEEKIEQLAASLAKKGLIFNQPNSAGIMIYRLLPLMTVGLMEYKFMGELKWDEEEKQLAELFHFSANSHSLQLQSANEQLVLQKLNAKHFPIDMLVYGPQNSNLRFQS